MPNDIERADLLAELAKARASLVRAADGLSDEQAAEQPTVSELCIGGLIKHVAAAEDGWLRVIADGPAAMSFELPEGVSWHEIVTGTAAEYPQWMIERRRQFQVLPGETLAGILAGYAEVRAHTDQIVAGLTDLDTRFTLAPTPWGEPAKEQSIRATLLHVIAETAQHAGHADIIRETIDKRKSG
jgi:uncharacterized damage-inducible protein DinB